MYAINESKEAISYHSPQFCRPSCLADLYALTVIVDQFILQSLQDSGQSHNYHPRTWNRLYRFILQEMHTFSRAHNYELNCALSRFYASGGTLLEDPSIRKENWSLNEKQMRTLWEVFTKKIEGYIQSPIDEQKPLQIFIKMRACAATLFFYLSYYCPVEELQKALQEVSFEIIKNTLDFTYKYVTLNSTKDSP